MSTQAGQRPDVVIWGVQDRRANTRYARPWIVRWKVVDKKFQRGFRTRQEADHYRSRLLVAQRDGLPFDSAGGEPLSWSVAAADIGFHVWVRRWLGEQWPEWQPRTRDSAVQALSRFVPLVVTDKAPEPVGLRQYLIKALRPDSELDEGFEAWMDKWCLRLGDLNRRALATAERDLGLGVSGQPLGAGTASKYRTVAHSCVRRAVDLELLESDPWPPPVRGASNRKIRKVKKTVDVKLLPDPVTMARALAAMETHQPASRTYRLMTSVLYYGGLRPSEVVMLRKRALTLPESGWGLIGVTEADISFDESGEPKTGPRTVPIPPVLVAALTEWLDAHEFADEDLLFRTRTGRMPTASNWGRSWHRALKSIGEEPLRLYDCRHAAATTWLGAGVPLGEAARRLGHSVEVLVSTYVGALTGDEVASNSMIDRVLGASGAGL